MPSTSSLLISQHQEKTQQLKKVKEQISIMKEQYTSYLRKKDSLGKIKKGQETRYAFYEKELSSVKAKAEKETSECDRKIEKYEARIDHLKRELAVQVAQLEAKIAEEEKKKTKISEHVEERSQNYYTPIFTSLLEAAEVSEEDHILAKMPPSYYKLQAQEETLEREIASLHTFLMAEHAKGPQAPEPDEEDIALQKRREQRRREAAEEARRAEEAQREAEIAEYEAKRAVKKAEEDRVAAKRESAPQMSPEEKKREEERLAIHLREALASEEYKLLNQEGDSEVSGITSDAHSVATEDTELTYPPPRRYPALPPKQLRQTVFPPAPVVESQYGKVLQTSKPKKPIKVVPSRA